MRDLDRRIAKLEIGSLPSRSYVVRVSDPMTAEERDAIAKAMGPIIIVPHKCRSVEEWIEQYAPEAA